MTPDKPLIKARYHPKARRIYWGVSLMPKPYTSSGCKRWHAANLFACMLNARIAEAGGDGRAHYHTEITQ